MFIFPNPLLFPRTRCAHTPAHSSARRNQLYLNTWTIIRIIHFLLSLQCDSLQSALHKLPFFKKIEVQLTYNIILVSGVHIVIQYFIHYKMITSLVTISPYKITTILLTRFPMLSIIFPWLIYFVIGSLCLSASLSYFTHASIFLSSGNCQFVLCEPVSVLLCLFVGFVF